MQKSQEKNKMLVLLEFARVRIYVGRILPIGSAAKTWAVLAPCSHQKSNRDTIATVTAGSLSEQSLLTIANLSKSLDA
jgi:hypothetical protein